MYDLQVGDIVQAGKKISFFLYSIKYFNSGNFGSTVLTSEASLMLKTLYNLQFQQLKQSELYFQSSIILQAIINSN